MTFFLSAIIRVKIRVSYDLLRENSKIGLICSELLLAVQVKIRREKIIVPPWYGSAVGLRIRIFLVGYGKFSLGTTGTYFGYVKLYAGLRIWTFLVGSGRVADPVHFRPDPAPDPDPANHNFKTGSQIRNLLALKESIQTFFHIKHISSDIWMMSFFYLKTWKNSPENV